MPLEPLSHKQARFLLLVCDFIPKVTALGFTVTGGELLRTQVQADWNAKHGIGISTSLHMAKLAIDLCLYKDGVYLIRSEDYKPAGDLWKTLAPDARWGGDFKDSKGNPKPDGNHFSLEHEGRK